MSYDKDAIFHEFGPFDPCFINESVRTLIRTLPLDDPNEPEEWGYRRMYCALTAMSALNPRDEIEIMLSVQALAAYHSASASWRLGMNLTKPHATSIRHINSAASAARTFDTLLKAMERRQAKPLGIPPGRPEPRYWDQTNVTKVMQDWEARCSKKTNVEVEVEWTPEALKDAKAYVEQQRIELENEGLDIANTEGILPDGSIIMPEDPTPQQAAYIARRIANMYRREMHENRRAGNTVTPKIRPIRTGDLIP